MGWVEANYFSAFPLDRKRHEIKTEQFGLLMVEQGQHTEKMKLAAGVAHMHVGVWHAGRL